MTEVNGYVEESKRSVTPSLHLGKRKRSVSPEKPTISAVNGSDTSIKNLIRELKQHDFALKVLHHPVSKQATDIPAAKKLRTESERDSIEARIGQDAYGTLDDFLLDLKQASHDLSPDVASSITISTADKLTKSQHVQLDRLISQYSHPDNTSTTQQSTSLPNDTNQVLSVRSAVEGGAVRQLFTGLRLQPNSHRQFEAIDAKKLPHGFDVIEATTLPLPRRPQTADKRTFGAVFGQQRNLRQLETPKLSRGAHSNRLDFEKPFENLAISNKQDYRYAQLNTGLSLRYHSTKQEIGKTPNTSENASQSVTSEALFSAAYSSFAPSQDREYAIVSLSDKSRQYWHKYGSDAWRLNGIHSNNANTGTITDYPDPDLLDFDAVIADYTPPDSDEERADAFKTSKPQDEANTKEVDEIMEEVAELLQTLASFQKMRDLEKNAVPGASVKPTQLEQDSFELLRLQLKVLVDGLPPFAVAKLDGDQLKALNVSTTILLDPPDIVGTGQPDDYTLRRSRAAQVPPQVALGRSTTQPQMHTRPYSSTQTPSTTYNSSRPTFNSNTSQTPSVPGYASRGPNAGFYNTPRPNPTPAYNHQTTGYRQPPFPNATIQQYQRSLQNGYQHNMTMSQSYTQQRPNSYLSNPQVPNSSTPSKPAMMNGATSFQNTQQSARPPYSPSPVTNTWGAASAQATIKAQQQLQQQREQAQSSTDEAQRQASSTPQPNTVSDSNTIYVATNGKESPSPQSDHRESATPGPAPVAAAVSK